MAIANVSNTSIFFSWVNTTNQLIVMLNGMFESNGSLSLPSLNITGNAIVTNNVTTSFLEIAGNDLGNELNDLWIQSNSTFVSINTSGTDANTVGAISNGAYGAANAAFVTTNAASNLILLANNLTQSGFAYANNLYISANSLQMMANAANQAGTYENRVVNGDFAINQRFEGDTFFSWTGANPPGPITYCDMWSLNLGGNTAGNVSVNLFQAPVWFNGIGTVNVPIRSNSWFGVFTNQSCNANVFAHGQNSWGILRHTIEGPDIADLNWGTANAANVILSFWMLVAGNTESALGNYTFSLYSNSTNLVAGTCRSYATKINYNEANTFLYYAIPIPGDTNTAATWTSDVNYPGLTIAFSLGVSNDNPTQVTSNINQWITGDAPWANGCVNFLTCNGATFGITGVRLREGNIDVPYYRRPYHQELRMCKRRFQKSYPAGVPVGTNTWNFSFPVPPEFSAYTNYNYTVPLVIAAGPGGGFNNTWPFEVEMLYPTYRGDVGIVYQSDYPLYGYLFQGMTLWAANGQIGQAYIDSITVNANSPIDAYAGTKAFSTIFNEGTLTWSIGVDDQPYVEFHYAIAVDL